MRFIYMQFCNIISTPPRPQLYHHTYGAFMISTTSSWDIMHMFDINVMRSCCDISDHFIHWCLNMMTSWNGNIFRVTDPLCGESTSQWRGALIFSLMCAWTNSSKNGRGAGDLRLHDVNVTYMSWISAVYVKTKINFWHMYVNSHHPYLTKVCNWSMHCLFRWWVAEVILIYSGNSN